MYPLSTCLIADQKLDLSYGLTIEPERGCDLSQDDKTFFKTLQIEKIKQKEKVDTGGWETMTIAVNPFQLKKCLTQLDIDSILMQKARFATFKWDNSRLNFNPANDKNWYCFSISLFSKDRRKAVIMIRNLCPGLCGTGGTILFTILRGRSNANACT